MDYKRFKEGFVKNNFTSKEKRQIVIANTRVGSWRCLGAGEIAADILDNDNNPIGELSGDNGTNRMYTTGEPFVESIEDFDDKDIAGLFDRLESIMCPHD